MIMILMMMMMMIITLMIIIMIIVIIMIVIMINTIMKTKVILNAYLYISIAINLKSSFTDYIEITFLTKFTLLNRKGDRLRRPQTELTLVSRALSHPSDLTTHCHLTCFRASTRGSHF